MMNDKPRNQAFEEAILARLEPGDTVLDIGCGAGLLSLMAARGGAQKVIAIEGEAEVADAAEEIFAQNGYEDQIQLVRGRSTNLRLGVDIPERADLLVSEIFDVSLLGEDALNTFQHAQRELLKPNAKVIPAQARVWCALVESDELRVASMWMTLVALISAPSIACVTRESFSSTSDASNMRCSMSQRSSHTSTLRSRSR